MPSIQDRCVAACGTVHYNRHITTDCGQHAEWDDGSGMGYRCHTCMAIVGSIGMPKHCHEIMKTNQAFNRLGAEN